MVYGVSTEPNGSRHVGSPFIYPLPVRFFGASPFTSLRNWLLYNLKQRISDVRGVRYLYVFIQGKFWVLHFGNTQRNG